jgi:hypothetical protein
MKFDVMCREAIAKREQGYVDIKIRRADDSIVEVRLVLRREFHPCRVCQEPTQFGFIVPDGYDVALCSYGCLRETGVDLIVDTYIFHVCGVMPGWCEQPDDEAELGN